mmetsp:Transcript_11227/g.69338  ORF Transcript_11227/g.69338 Transcript_11227/m.69338 type:complete len:144 (-) Transcript_11227:3395-3826(-)
MKKQLEPHAEETRSKVTNASARTWTIRLKRRHGLADPRAKVSRPLPYKKRKESTAALLFQRRRISKDAFEHQQDSAHTLCLEKHARSNLHRHQLLKQQFAGIRQVDLHDICLVATGAALVRALLQVGDRNEPAPLADMDAIRI